MPSRRTTGRARASPARSATREPCERPGSRDPSRREREWPGFETGPRRSAPRRGQSASAEVGQADEVGPGVEVEVDRLGGSPVRGRRSGNDSQASFAPFRRPGRARSARPRPGRRVRRRRGRCGHPCRGRPRAGRRSDASDFRSFKGSAWNAPARSLRIASGGSPSAATTRSMSRSSSMSSAATAVCEPCPAARASSAGECGREGDREPLCRPEVGRGDGQRGPVALDLAGDRRGLAVVPVSRRWPARSAAARSPKRDRRRRPGRS